MMFSFITPKIEFWKILFLEEVISFSPYDYSVMANGIPQSSFVLLLTITCFMCSIAIKIKNFIFIGTWKEEEVFCEQPWNFYIQLFNYIFKENTKQYTYIF